MVSKLKKALVIIIPVFLLIAVINIRENVIKNPIRSMYLAGKRTDYNELYAIKELELFFDDGVSAHDKVIETIDGKYKKEYLMDEIELYVFFYKNDLVFGGRYKISSRIKLLFSFRYEPKNNTLYYDALRMLDYEGNDYGEIITNETEIRRTLNRLNISEEDIRDIQRYIVYDVVITSWRSRHGDPPELIHDYNLNIEDHTFDFTE